MVNETLQNKRRLKPRVGAGDLDQYFDLSEEAIKDLAQSRENDDFEDMAMVLQQNISSGGQGIESLLLQSYDSELEDVADNIIRDYFRGIEARSIRAVKDLDLEEIRDIKEELEDFPDSPGFIRQKDKIFKQISEIERKISVPENLEKIAALIAKRKGIDVADIRTTKLLPKWGRSGKKAVVSWGSKGVVGVQFLDKRATMRKEKVKVEYIPTKEELRDKTPKQILTKRGESFTVKERLFLNSRKNKEDDEVYEDYKRVFGDIRPKSEVIYERKAVL